jgi:hypothetical protein
MDNESMNESYASPEENHENGGPRDMLLLKCRDAIESLHGEIEEERIEKSRIQEELTECQRYINDMQM